MSAMTVVTIVCGCLSFYFSKRQVEFIRARERAAVRESVRKAIEEHRRLSRPAAEPNPYDDAAAGFRLKIDGKQEFRNQVTSALQLLLQYDKDVFLQVRQYIYVIKRAEKTDFGIIDGAPAIMLTDATAFRSPTWCAGAIGRQLFHAKRYFERESLRRYLAQAPVQGRAPDPRLAASPLLQDLKDARTFENMERTADIFQMELMRKVGAPRAELDLIQRRKPFDYSLVNDGKYGLK